VGLLKTALDAAEARRFAERWLPAWSGNRPELLVSFYTEDAFYSDPAIPHGVQGRAPLLAYFQKLLARNPDWVWTQRGSLPLADGFLNEWHASIPAGGGVVEVDGVCTVQLRNGLIHRNQVYFDRSALLAALSGGGSAAPGAADAAAHPDPLVTTPRLLLRRFRSSDLPTFVAYRNDPEVARYQGFGGCTDAEGRAFIEEQRTLPLFERGRWSQLAVEARESGAHIGDCAVRITARDPRQAELGFSFARAHQGRGLATEAVTHLLDHLLSRLGLHRVFAIADARNERAVALLGRVGMRREGHFRDAEWFKGTWASDVLYALLASERRRPDRR
jgi:RimJ/RimL family protein N-acetyltransferase